MTSEVSSNVITTYKPHPIADIFPLISGQEFVDLKQDIKSNGLHEAIVLYDGMILDGRNRFRACQESGVTPQFVEYTGNDPVGYVISLNLRRRHLNESQRAMVAARIANLELGANQHSASANLQTQTRAKAAEQLNVSERTVNTAKKVEREGTPELIEAVEAGRLSVSAAADISSLPKNDQVELVARGEREILEKAKEIRAEKAKVRREENERIRRETKSIPFDGKYDVLVIDPPWPMQKIERDCRPNQTSDLDYPIMDEAEIAALDLPFSDDCHVFLWTTHKFLPMALRLFDAWEVKYVCNFVWHKPGGPQPYNLPQYNCEFCLYGRKGAPVFVDTKAFNTCFSAPRGAHSEKPAEFYSTICRVTDGRRIDVFNRRPIPGFAVWGNQSEGAA